MSLIHQDRPRIEDRLGFLPRVLEIGNLLATCKPPLVFGLHGGWGSGKTSFLAQLHLYLTGHAPDGTIDPDDKSDARAISESLRALGVADSKESHSHIVVVWFEAWRYQNDPNPVVALLHEIRESLGLTARTKREIRKLGEVTIRSCLSLLDQVKNLIPAGAVLPGVSQVIAEGERYETAHNLNPPPSAVLREQLRGAISSLLPPSPPPKPASRLVVLVDDLDRCEPLVSYRLLEGIRLYLHLPNTVFVLATDPGALADAVARARGYQGGKELTEGRARAREYLEKICQHSVPVGTEWDPGSYFRGLLKSFRTDYPKPFAGACDKATDLAGAHHVLSHNPRMIKAYGNACRPFLERAVDPSRVQGTDDDHRLMMVLALAWLSRFQPELYQQVEARPEFWNSRLLPWCRGRSAGSREEDDPLFTGLIPLSPSQQEDVTSETASVDPVQPGHHLFGDVRIFRIQGLVLALGAVEGSLIRSVAGHGGPSSSPNSGGPASKISS